jgi:23S rRNA pseudouridine2457 synthase
MLVLFNKPFNVLSQFTGSAGERTLAEFIDIPDVYAAGRLDADSEGLLALTDNGVLQAMIAGGAHNGKNIRGSTSSPRTGVRVSAAFTPVLDTGSPRTAEITRPRNKVTKTYWAQVEGIASDAQTMELSRGVTLKDGPTLPAKCRVLSEITEPWPRTPPIRVRKSVPDSWIELTISEGRNRQVRRMTAAVGLPTLRLIRVAIGPWRVDGLAPGEFRVINDDAAFAALRLG